MSVELVGILNVTPDSFSDGGLFATATAALTQAKQLFADGASIIDVGAEATNPKATAISSEEEWARLGPVLQALLPLLHDYNFSIDTRHAATIERVVGLVGPLKFYVNDVTTFIDDELSAVTAKYGLSAIISHSALAAGGDIEAIHATSMESVEVVVAELNQQKDKLISLGLPAEHIILDPGIGFGKSMKLNWQLLEFADYMPGVPLMTGHSNKRFLATNPVSGEIDESIDRYGNEANIAAAKIAIESSKIRKNRLLLRVHKPALYRQLLTI
jgi:dihydropteroate synthase